MNSGRLGGFSVSEVRMTIRTGRITLVQESRFQLLGEDGRATLFILAHDAAIEPQDLPALQHAQARVRVHGSPAPGLVAQVARRLDILEPPSR